MLTLKGFSVNFKSNPERERELARLKELRRIEAEYIQNLIRMHQELDKRKAPETKKILEEKGVDLQLPDIERTIESVTYPEIDNEVSKKVAGFFSQFTCAIQNNSEHDLKEFFGDEKTAEELRSNLSPACQHDSIELRNELKNMMEMKDPIMMLMCANKMKKFAPKQGLLSDSKYKDYLNGLKNVIDDVIKNTDLSKFEVDERNSILEMVQMIKGSQTTDFGISVKLKALVDKINKRKLNMAFIPPVMVKNLESNITKIKI
jgi:hypothetical protein